MEQWRKVCVLPNKSHPVGQAAAAAVLQIGWWCVGVQGTATHRLWRHSAAAKQSSSTSATRELESGERRRGAVGGFISASDWRRGKMACGTPRWEQVGEDSEVAGAACTCRMR